jgi:hypothetical protein
VLFKKLLGGGCLSTSSNWGEAVQVATGRVLFIKLLGGNCSSSYWEEAVQGATGRKLFK